MAGSPSGGAHVTCRPILATTTGAYVFVVVLGLLWGSFANVCVYRWPPSEAFPEGRSVVAPGSACMACGTPIRWYDNVPLLSYLWLRGRCRACGVGFSARYLINDLIRPVYPAPEYDNTENRDWLLRFMQQIVRRDFYEFNALPYTRYSTKAILALKNYAPDSTVQVAATGVLDWLFIKQALSGNMDRDHRPFRRRPERDRLSAAPCGARWAPPPWPRRRCWPARSSTCTATSTWSWTASRGWQ